MINIKFIDLSEYVKNIDPDATFSTQDRNFVIEGFSSIHCTRENTLSWMRAQEIDWSSIKACTVICDSKFVCPADTSIVFIKTVNPRLLFAKVLGYFSRYLSTYGVHKTAILSDNVKLGDRVSIGAYTIIGNNVCIGDNSIIRNHVVIHDNVTIGRNCLVKSGSVIGEEGFGLAEDVDGTCVRFPHIGGVIIGNHVEIGSMNTVCSGTMEPTVLHDWVKIDDHVHIAHNVTVGRSCRITACVEISGSVSVGQGVWIGPNSTILDGISIGESAYIGAGANVLRSVPARSKIIGIPSKVVGNI